MVRTSPLPARSLASMGSERGEPEVLWAGTRWTRSGSSDVSPGIEQVVPAQYREAVDGARDPAGWKQLARLLRRWRHHAEAVKDPGYTEALEAARGPVSGGMLLEDAVRLHRPAS